MYCGRCRMALSVIGSLVLTGLYGVCVEGDYAYVTRVTNNSVYSIYISDHTNPTVEDSVRSDAVLMNARGIRKYRDYVFATSPNNDKLTAINVSDPSNLSIQSSVTLGGGWAPWNLDIYDSAGVIYAALASLCETFSIVDITDVNNMVVKSVNTQPPSPRRNNFGIAVKGNYAYATGQDTDRFRSIDISTPTLPVHKDQIQSSTQLDGACCIVISDNYAFVINTFDGMITTIDISNPLNLSIVGTKTDTTHLLQGHTIALLGNTLFTACHGYFCAWDVSNPVNINLLEYLYGAPVNHFESSPWDMFISGDYAYIADTGNGKFTIVDISDYAPKKGGSSALPIFAKMLSG